MKKQIKTAVLFCTVLILFNQLLKATTVYVDGINGNDSYSGNSWTEAKRTIQVAVDLIGSGDMVLVKQGTYNTGGAVSPGCVISNRVFLSASITLRAVDGPDMTFIEGQGDHYSPSVTRCVNATDGAVIEGFTLMNGYTGDAADLYEDRCGGGAWLEGNALLTNCIVRGNSGWTYGGGVYSGLVHYCKIELNDCYYGGGTAGGEIRNSTIMDNEGIYGGGAYACSLFTCQLSGNEALAGGGAYAGFAIGCAIENNTAGNTGGGGVYDTAATDCLIKGNSSEGGGGGALVASLDSCMVIENFAVDDGGGLKFSTAGNSVISGNRADNLGGGMFSSTLNNCTLTQNYEDDSGSGFPVNHYTNCISWFNRTKYGGVSQGFAVDYKVAGGGYNRRITDYPEFISSSHIATNSLCVGAGYWPNVSGSDLDGDVWLNPPSIGCDEPHEGVADGYLYVNLLDLPARVLSGRMVEVSALVIGKPSLFSLDLGDGMVVTNSLITPHVWSETGVVDVVLIAFNADYPAGLSVTQSVEVLSPESTTIHVAPDGDDVNDGLSRLNAKQTIQAGVNAQTLEGGLVYVYSGTYTLSSEISITNDIVVQGGGSRDKIVVDGNNSVRCFNLIGSVTTLISGLTIYNGHGGNGAGVYALHGNHVVNNCVVRDCHSNNNGGGVQGCNVQNSYILENSAEYYGGGLRFCDVENSLISGNAVFGDGSASAMSGGVAVNCTIVYNDARLDDGDGSIIRGSALTNCIVCSNYTFSVVLVDTTAEYSCCPELAHGEDGNITNVPVFVDAANGNYRLQPGSPGVDSGTNLHGLENDLDGHERIINGVTDMGAYELVQEYAFSSPMHYVDESNPAPAWPYTNWLTAARCIQDAVETAASGDSVMVTNGTYNTGGTVAGMLDTRVALVKPIALRSVNGPAATHIIGAGINGPDAIRCAYICSGASVSGFTLTNGHTHITGNYAEKCGGGAWLESSGVLSNCVVTICAAAVDGGGTYGGLIYNSQYRWNIAASYGGGAASAIVRDSTFNSCIASVSGGGLYDSSVFDSDFQDNYAGSGGGAMYKGSAECCLISDNSTDYNGGGVYDCTIEKCYISGNEAMNEGGGSYMSNLKNCLLAGNTASIGGGLSYGLVNNCTLRDNIAYTYGGAFCYCTATNCIVWDNFPEYMEIIAANVSHSCSDDLAHGFDGNITSPPDFLLGTSRLLPGSPCIDSGTPLSTVIDDLDGVPRPLDGNADGSVAHDMGAFEYVNARSDSDGDGLSDLAEIRRYGSSPVLADSDGDGRTDPEEITSGYSPVYNESPVIAAAEAAGESNVTSNPGAYGLYTSDSIFDLSLGLLMIQTSSGNANLDIQLLKCDDLVGNVWSNAGEKVEWVLPAPAGKAFFRVRASE